MFVGISGFPELLMDDVSLSLLVVFIASFMIVFAGLLLRRKWLGVAVVCLIWTVVQVAQSTSTNQTPYELVANVLAIILFVLIPARFGVLALLSTFLFSNIFHRPVTTDLSAWYATEFISYALVLVAL